MEEEHVDSQHSSVNDEPVRVKVEPTETDDFESLNEYTYEPPEKRIKTEKFYNEFILEEGETSGSGATATAGQKLEATPKQTFKRRTLSYAEKVEICEKNANGKSVSELCAEYGGLHGKTVLKIINNKDKLMEKIAMNPMILDCKKLKAVQEPRIEAALKMWLQQEKESNDYFKVTGPKIREKALEFAQQFGVTNFKASSGWLEGFIRRNNISFKSWSKSNELTNAANWMDLVFMPLLKKFHPDDVFTLGEFALFYRLTPHKTFEFRNNCSDGKYSSERVTACVGANKSGTEKLPLLVIGKLKDYRCFKNVKSLPAKFETEPSAWMTSEIFENYILLLDKKFQKENRSVLVVVEPSSAHPASLASKLSNIHLVFQQPNSPSPLRQSLAKNIKHFYRKEIVSKEVNALDPNYTGTPVDILEAMTILAESWEKVTDDIIERAFIKAGWSEETFDGEYENDEDELEFGAYFKACLRMLNIDFISYIQYLTVDDLVATSGILTDEDICKAVSEDKNQDFKIKMPDLTVNSLNCVRVHEKVIEPRIEPQIEDLTSKKRKILSIAEKLEIAERKKQGASTKELCEEFGISKSALCTILQSEEKLRERMAKNPHMSEYRRFRPCKYPKFEEDLLAWIEENKTVITGMKIREKALEIAPQYGYEKFQASNGWWEGFKKRHGVGFQRFEMRNVEKSFDESVEDPLMGM